jgi:uncharacterized repeat protein (TIGR01451 family)
MCARSARFWGYATCASLADLSGRLVLRPSARRCLPATLTDRAGLTDWFGFWESAGGFMVCGRIESVFGRSGRVGALAVAMMVAIAGVVAMPTAAHADTLVGCDTAGLVAAINAANTAGGGTLDLTAGCTYKLTAGALPSVTTPITIHGHGATIERVATAPQFRLIAVDSYGGSLTADALTLTGGNDPANDGGGGGIYDYLGTVNLTNSTVSGNIASGNGFGGGIANVAGTVTLTNSTISGNTSGEVVAGGGVGGGIANDGALTVTNSAISANTAYVYGGGIYSAKYTFLTVTNSTMSGNTVYAYTSDGGGIRDDSVYGSVMTNSTVSGNTAVSGAGISVNGGTVTLTNGTISGNTASGSGGGILDNSGTVTLTNGTISGNTASGSGGGIDNGGTVAIYSSIVSGNTGGNCGGSPVRSGGYNLDSDGTCGLTAATDKNNVDPQLGPLQGNGGPTETMAPASTSPVVDAIPKGTNGCGTTIKTDQRGVPRPQGAGCDTGAFETGDVAMQSLRAKPKSVVSGANVTYTATVMNADAVDATGVTVTDTLPTGLTFSSATASQGTCSFVAPTLTCNLGQFAAATTATVKITVKVAAAASTTIRDTATVSATTGDTIPGNDTKTAKINVT